VNAFTWLEVWGKTPLDLGLRPDQLDPAWSDAVVIIKNALEEERALHLET
jgi:hypothetical protein